MENDLIMAQTENKIQVIEKKDLGEIIKPLVKEIHLFDSFIAGTTHLEDGSVLESVSVGDTLILQREKNKFDDNAILLLTSDNKKIGYIPEKDNIIFARLMDAGKLLRAKISDIEKKGSFNRISIGIYLVDF